MTILNQIRNVSFFMSLLTDTIFINVFCSNQLHHCKNLCMCKICRKYLNIPVLSTTSFSTERCSGELKNCYMRGGKIMKHRSNNDKYKTEIFGK